MKLWEWGLLGIGGYLLYKEISSDVSAGIGKWMVGPEWTWGALPGTTAPPNTGSAALDARILLNRQIQHLNELWQILGIPIHIPQVG